MIVRKNAFKRIKVVQEHSLTALLKDLPINSLEMLTLY